MSAPAEPLAWAELSDEALHDAAVEIGAIYDRRPEALAYISRVRYEYLMTAPGPPSRWKGAAGGAESGLWLEWHRLRGLDPHARRWRSIPVALRRAVIARDGYVCGICGGAVTPDDVHIDHVHPVALGGPTELGNLQVAHSRCNIRKGARA